MRFLYLLFFLSGIPALIYQIIWQRALFNIFGSNIEAVTLVVSSFMLGLGMGSLVGGRLSTNAKFSPLLLFAFFELGIGAFGLVSLRLIDTVGIYTVQFGPVQTFVASFTTVLFPTVLMGATLPLLLMHLVRKRGVVGDSISLLYSINTWGSAFACLIGALYIFGIFGMHGSVNVAASMNIAVGIGALWFSTNTDSSEPERAVAEDVQNTRHKTLLNSTSISPRTAILVAGFAGFISLSYEIVWARAFFLALAGSAFSFPFVLGFFLTGIGIGAYASRQGLAWFRQQVATYNYLPFAVLLIVASVLSFLTIPALNYYSVSVAALFLTASAAAFGAFLPLISELAIRADSKSGKWVSFLYVANIVGSTSGTIITGLWLLDNFNIHQVAGILFALSSAGVAILLFSHPNRIARYASTAFTLLMITPTAWIAAPYLHKDLYANLQARLTGNGQINIESIAESKSGVVTITDEKMVFGTGIYDGRVMVDMLNDKNGLYRPAAVAAVHPDPKRILVIGLSMGAWTQVLANMPTVEEVQVVEIDRGYLDLIEKYPVVASLLDDPKVAIWIDDGRRWMRRNPQEKFDVIVANTTFNWRAGASNLLSVEFLEQIKSHLNPGGIYFYNSTSSDRVQRTGASAFKHAARFQHFLFASQEPLIFNKDLWLSRVKYWTINGLPLLDLATAEGLNKANEITKLFEKIGPLNPRNELEPAIEYRDDILERTRGLELITDDNMGVEWTGN